MKQMTLMESKHAHHYILETPTGPIVHGMCKNCGAEGDWPAYEDTTTADFRKPRQHGKGVRK